MENVHPIVGVGVDVLGLVVDLVFDVLTVLLLSKKAGTSLYESLHTPYGTTNGKH